MNEQIFKLNNERIDLVNRISKIHNKAKHINNIDVLKPE